MKYGMFMMPNHPPERSLYDGIQQDLREIDWLDEFGYSEVWIGEHLTAPWEPFPAGDLIIAQALARTENIKICSGGTSAASPPARSRPTGRSPTSTG
jgi:alkanesulfonate monooxygenase SsuD/methylene tetrahydromethanopterin reductase-like flavin-dependent oxidoreductase (luciferase family)